jgi:hypothetical protein
VHDRGDSPTSSRGVLNPSPGRKQEPSARRRPYVAPRLEAVAFLQQVVLGSSPGAGDSGAGMFTEFGPGGPP